jgi:hypothetical protein
MMVISCAKYLKSYIKSNGYEEIITLTLGVAT